MKTILKRTLVLFLAAMMAFTSLPLAFAKDSPDTGLSMTETAVGTNPLAAAVADAVNDRTGNETTYSILGMELDGFTAAVTCYAPAGSTMVAALYDENTAQMLTSGSVKLEEEAEFVNVEMTECKQPEYYYAKVFFLAQDNPALAETFTYSRHTRRMEEFYAITPEDFDADHVVMYENEDNFAAVNENAVIVKSAESTNTVIESDHENNKYTIENPDTALKALKKGDVFYMELEDDLIVGKITKIETNKDGSVTVFTDPDEAPISFFEYIHVDTKSLTEEPTGGNAPRNTSTNDYDEHKEKNLKYELDVSFSVPQDPKNVKIPKNWKQQNVENDSLKVDKDNSGPETKFEILFDGKATVSMDIEYCYHMKWGPDDYYLNIDTTASLEGSVSISGSIGAKVTFNLVKFSIPTPVVGLSVYVKLVCKLGISGKISATGTLKISVTHNKHQESADKNKNQSKWGTPSFEASFDVEISVTVTGELKLGIGIEVAYGVVSIGLFGNVKATIVFKPFSFSLSDKEIGVALSNKDWTAYADGEIHAQHDCTICLTVDVKVTASVGLEVDWFKTKDYEKEDLMTLANKLSPELSVTWTLLEKTARASLINGKLEFDWMDKDVACPHMRFLTKITLTEKDSKKAMADVPLKISSVNNKWNPVSKYASIPKETNIKTDDKGVARCYLPTATYKLDVADKSVKIVECSPDNEEFRIMDDMVNFTAVGITGKEYTVKVIEDDTGHPLQNAKITFNGDQYTTDSGGNVKMRLFPEDEINLTISTKGIHQIIKTTVPKDQTVIEVRVHQGQWKIVGTVVNKTDGQPLSGVKVETAQSSGGDAAVTTTDKDGKFSFQLDSGSYEMSFVLDDYAEQTVTKNITNDADIGTIQLKETNPSHLTTGDHIQFGTYPQSRVMDAATISKLDAASKTWASYGYYSGTENWNDGQMTPGDFMQFADFKVGGVKYRAVKFSEYRPYFTGYTRTASNSYQDENGYTPNVTYYFKYEPLSWRVLNAATGYVMCENLIDAQAYQNTIYCQRSGVYYQGISSSVYANDYATSSIRDWLNHDFYETAFADAQKANIKTTTLNNDSLSSPKYNSASTSDKIFLSSYADAKNSAFGFSANASAEDAARFAQGTDYAQCQGLWVYRNSSSQYDRNSFWWLRSPGDYAYWSLIVEPDGSLNDHGDIVVCTNVAVRPACRLSNLTSDISQSDNLFSQRKTSEAKPAPRKINSMPSNTTDLPIFSVRNAAGQTASRANAVKGEEYLLLVVKDASAENLLAADNLLYIDQQTAESETVTFTYVPREEFAEAVATIYGADKDSHVHKYTATVTKEATCVSPGEMTYSCPCGDSYTEEVPATDTHRWNDGEVTTTATCTTEGVKTFTCTVCNITKTETIDKNTDNHTGGTEIRSVKAATCAAAGYTGDTYCKGCGEKIETGMTIAMTTIHTYDTGKVTKEPTCKEDGVKTFTCTVCGATKTESLAKTADHKWDNGKVTREATSAADGVKTFTCTVCGTTRTESIPKLADHTHTWDAGKVTKEPTCKEDGVKTYTCSACGATKTESLAKTADHKWDAGTVTKEATETAEGVKTYICTVCGATKTESIPKQTPADQDKFLLGDADGNGKVESSDARLALRASVHLSNEPTDIKEGTVGFRAADYDQNGKVESSDARCILRVSVKLDPFG